MIDPKNVNSEEWGFLFFKDFQIPGVSTLSIFSIKIKHLLMPVNGHGKNAM